MCFFTSGKAIQRGLSFGSSVASISILVFFNFYFKSVCYGLLLILLYLIGPLWDRHAVIRISVNFPRRAWFSLVTV